MLEEIQYEPVLDKHVGKRNEKVVVQKQAKNKDPMKHSQ